MREEFEGAVGAKQRAIDYLEYIGCPPEIIEQIENWQPQKMITPVDLANWNKWVGTKP